MFLFFVVVVCLVYFLGGGGEEREGDLYLENNGGTWCIQMLFVTIAESAVKIKQEP